MRLRSTKNSKRKILKMSCFRTNRHMQWNCSFHFYHQLKNFKVFVTRGLSNMCPGMESPTSSLSLISYRVKALSHFRKIMFDWKWFKTFWPVSPKYPNIFDIEKNCFMILLISVDHAIVLRVLFYKILTTLSVPL